MLRKSLLSLVVALGVAGWALAQTASKQSGSPTTNSYRIKILEPLEGATITGPNVTIVMAKPDVPQGTAVNEPERTDALTPTFQVWVDGKDYGNLPIGENVFRASDLSYGPHTAIVAAKNTAGELVGRVELKFTTAEAVGATTTMETSSTTERTEMAPPPAPPAAVAPPPPAPEPPPAPAMEQETMTADSPTLPATGTNYPLAALAGLGLMGAGIALRRRA
jgi:LPXTG-motif cell wall-anchored protein